ARSRPRRDSAPTLGLDGRADGPYGCSTRGSREAESARTATGREETELPRAGDRLGAAVRVELCVDVAQVGPHRVGRDEELARDLGRLEVARQVADDAQLSLAELLVRRSDRSAALG